MLVQSRGRTYFQYNDKKYLLNSKAFDKFVNAERKNDVRVFYTLTIGGQLYAPNPYTIGKNSQSALIQLETNVKGQLTKRGEKKLQEINDAWDDKKYIVRKGKEYIINHNVSYTVERELRNGNVIVETKERSIPANTQPGTLPDAFKSNDIFKAELDMTKKELIEYMIEFVLKPQFTFNSSIGDIKTLSITATPVNGKQTLGNIVMRSLRYFYKSIDNNKETRDGSCVADYILSEIHKPNAFLQHITRKDVEHLKTANEIIEWAKEIGCISVYALSPLFEVFDKHIAERDTRATLIFVVNNGHCYAITDPTQRKMVVSCGKLELKPIDISKVDMDDVLYFETGVFHRTKKQKTESTQDIIDFIENATKNVILPLDTLDNVATTLISQTDKLIEHFHFSNGLMVAFQHPVKDIVIIAGCDFELRKAVCQEYFQRHKLIDFRFQNQGWGEIGRLISENGYGSTTQSNYSPHLKNIFEQYPIRPYRMCQSKDIEGVVSIDNHRCYTSVLINNDTEWNLFGSFDHIQPFAYTQGKALIPGEYYIAKDFYMGKGTIFISKGFYPLSLIKYALLKQYIQPSDLTFVIYADRHIKADLFKAFAEAMYKEYPDDSKMIVNLFIGCMGSLYHRNTKSGITSDLQTAIATIMESQKARMYDVNGLYIIQENEEFMKDIGDMPIYRQIIASSIVELDKMVEALSPEEIVCYNTDSVKIRGSYNSDIVKLKSECRNPGEYHVEDKVFLAGRPIDMLDRNEDFVYDTSSITYVSESEMDMERLKDGGVVLGMPGCGKTELIILLCKSLSQQELEDTVVLSYTNSSVGNIKARRIEAQTLSSLLWVGNSLSKLPLTKYKRVILDEFSMLPPYEMGLILNAQQEGTLKVICVGDPNQCKAPIDNWVRYDTNPLFLAMCNNYVITMEYKPGFARYDTELYEALMYFQANRELSNWECSEVESYQNICYSNAMRSIVNQRCLDRWVQEKGTTLTTFGFHICVGLPVMAYDDSDKEKQVFKTQVWTVLAIGDSQITLQRDDKLVTFDKTEFKRIFDYSFCYTTHKCQGITIKGHYNIYEAEKMMADVLYTAMSRGTKKQFVHIVSEKKAYYSETSRKTSILYKAPKVELMKGRIYKINLSNGAVYIGKTVKTIEERFAEHKANPTNDDMVDNLDDQATIELVDEFYFKDDKTFRDVETSYIARAIAKGHTLANRQHNIKIVPTKTKTGKARKLPTISIKEDLTKKRYEIQFRRECIEKDDQVKRFAWGNDKTKAYRDAERHREYLMYKYF